MSGAFIEARDRLLMEIARAMARREERAIIWSGRGWALPENQWRYYFRGAGCE